MSTAADPAAPQQARLHEHISRLSGLQVKLLIGFFILGVISVAGVVYSWSQTPATKTITVAHNNPSNASGFVGNAPAETTTVVTEAEQTWTQWTSGHGAKLGFGFVGGFIIGFIFRAFIKIMTLIGIVIFGGLAALSYFGILHVDMTAAHTAWTSNSDWIMTEATKLKDVLMAYLPSSTTGAAGLFVGLKRK